MRFGKKPIGLPNKKAKIAQAKVKERSRELGIPERFAPGLDLTWYHQGENATKERKNELRRLGKLQVDAMVKAGKLTNEFQ
jgi:hypothetical protein